MRAWVLLCRIVDIVVFLVRLLLAHKVLGTLVFVRAAILANILVSTDGLGNVSRREFVELLIVAKNDDGDVDGAEDGEFVRFFEETSFALQKGD